MWLMPAVWSARRFAVRLHHDDQHLLVGADAQLVDCSPGIGQDSRHGHRKLHRERLLDGGPQGKFVLNVISGSLHSIMGRQLSLASLRGLGTGFCRHRGA